MTDRFDLEQQILDCWKVVDDLDILCENVMDWEASRDDIANALLGMKTLYNMKFGKCFTTFEKCISDMVEDRK